MSCPIVDRGSSRRAVCFLSHTAASKGVTDPGMQRCAVCPAVALCSLVTLLPLSLSPSLPPSPSLTKLQKYSPMGFDTFEQSLWCTIVTMATVGYGDIYPVSLPGRVIITLGGIAGGTLTGGLVTTVFVDFAILSENEQRVVHVLER